ncbi:TPA: SpaH/EbpB family LPXTG-anchored major pilin [Streptococcus suis]
MKLIRKLVTGLMILLVALGSSPLEVFGIVPNEWPSVSSGNGTASDLPEPPAPENIVDLEQMFNYPTLDYSGLTTERRDELNVIKSLKGYVPVNDSSVAVITRDKPWQAGVMWSDDKDKDNKINLAEPFHMISYVYLGSRGQAEKIVDGNNRAGADGITFTIHNDNKSPVDASKSGSTTNTGKNAYGALGNGLGVYGSNFSANTASTNNNMAKMTQGVTNGIALEFDTFYNHNNTTQHSDNDLWQFMRKSGLYGPGNNGEGSPESNYGHIGINYLNQIQNNDANDGTSQFGYESGRVIKHNTMLAVGWDGEISESLYGGGGIPGLHYQNGWQVSKQPSIPLADRMWHRLEVSWVPSPTDQKKGKLTYKIYRQGYLGPARAVTTLTPTIHDGNSIIEKTLDIDVTTVFAVPDVNSTVYWGFSGSTGYYQNNQAVQMLQLPEAYYKSGILKVDEDNPNLVVEKAKFELQVLKGVDWETVEFQKADGSKQNFVLTGVDNDLIGVTTDLDKASPTYGTVTATQLLAGTYRWVEIEAPDGYQKIEENQKYYPIDTGFFVVNYSESLKKDNAFHFTATNKKLDFELTLEKLSSTFQDPLPLQGVEFELYDSAGGTDFSTQYLIDTVTTGVDGRIVLNNEQIQADKTYYLVESKTVGGFIQLKGYFIITTVAGTKVTYVKADTETDESPFEFPGFLTEDGINYKGHLKIYNKKLILPATGGNGILGYVGIGLTMTIVALLFFIARKRIFKWLIILIVATSGLAGLAGGTQVVSAQEQEQVQLEVNRLVYQPSDTQYKSGVPVAGAKLEVVDVTKSFYELVNRQKLSLKEAQEAVSKSNKIDGQSLAVATTDQSGLVRFTVSKTSQQRPAVYLIRELVTPVAVTKMENMVVVLPILDESGNEKSLISLFPKSHGTFTFDKTIDEKQSSYSFGEPIPYRLSTIIPQDMTNLSSYEIEDIYDQGLRFISESLEIFIDGEKQSDSIKAVSLSENQFRVVFDVAKLADFGGKKLEATYQMVIKDEAAIDQDLVNTATLYPGDLTPLVDRENVQTGGFRFIKRAAEGKQNPLAKATFVIKNPTDDTVLTYKEGKYQFEKVATNASGVVRLTSDDDGYFEIRGLRYGEYLVSEIRAPSGYVLNDKPTAFTVGVSTYSQGPVLSIFNVKKPKIRLPETGTVVTSTAFVGLLIMASSLVMIRRKKDN